nr:uncharacterized protein LOC124212273 [Neodiprion pinetum]
MKSLTNLLKSGGFELGKWMSNHPELLVGIGNCEASSPSARKFEPNEWVRTLGVVWTPSDDSFRVKLNLDLNHTTASKRSLLSELARIFDPLGWLASVLVYVKILFQDTWISGATWDEPLPAETLSPWLHLRSTLPRLEELVIPRWLGPTTHPRRYQLHGFSDASERAYAAAVYVRVCSEDDSYTVSLLCSKTKVAPVKSNRVAEIQTLLPNTTWQHVKSAENPADLATRGITPEQILQADLWWQGPSWLKGPQSEWPQRKLASVDITDLDTHIEPVVHATCIAEDNEILSRFSFLKRLLRVTAWFLSCRNGIPADHHVALEDLQLLSASEIAAARERWIIVTQRVAFPDEIAALQNKKLLPSRSALTRLNPFLDDGGVLRLGGRFQCTVLSYQERHPAILPGSSRFTDLLIWRAHDITLHGGAQLTMSHLLRYCWILGGRNKVRSLVRWCVECTRHQAPIPQQQMGQLPTARVNKLSRPFEKAGLDYAGPFLLRASSGRGRTTFKGYIALFVCLATRAIHLEVVGSYTTASFLPAFKRFTARRGIHSELHSDNGTNFRGADQELRHMFLAASATSREIASVPANDGVQWHFIPPSAPHFGGRWEAGVKSMKYHLRRVIGETIMTYEEFATVATQIEACLNSRLIAPLSSVPSDLVALTPGHFLIGGAPTTPPEPSTLHVPLERLGQYLHHLQQRNKWLKETKNIVVGDLVLLRDDLRPPAKWPLARVTETHPGPDGLTRVVMIKTATSSFQRPIVKLILLPVREPPLYNKT